MKDYGELLESKTTDSKLQSEQVIFTDSLWSSHLWSGSGGTGGARPPSTRLLWCQRSTHVAPSHLNSCISLSIKTLMWVWDGARDEGEGVQWEISASWFLEGLQERYAQGQAESLCRELLCFIAAGKENDLNLAPLVAPEERWSSEKERAPQALGPGIRWTRLQAFPACCHAAHMGAWEKNHREVLAGMKTADCCRNYCLKSFKF